MSAKCYGCIHRGEVPGSVHSSCHHPDVDQNNRAANLLATLASVGRIPPVVDCEGTTKLNIRGNAHGIRRGWFNWPYNFDPVWLENCDGFEPKDDTGS